MTVGELIQALEGLPGSLEVRVTTWEDEGEAVSVEVVQRAFPETRLVALIGTDPDEEE